MKHDHENSIACDVLIMGGGLAGLTLALQLRQQMPNLGILVLERRAHPVAEATHKVGESSVEIAAHYFDSVLGLKDHLTRKQLRKFGFRFFFSDARQDFDQVLELGASRHLSTPSYQIDRGIFENFLGEQAHARQVQFLDGAVIRKIRLAPSEDNHGVEFDRDGRSMHASARWLIDASGRAGLIKKHLGLARDNEHRANAVWFRIGARIDVNDWSGNAAWLNRCSPPHRWLSTNHLVGPGYWVWLIPLSSGSHSVGIVADSRLHPSRNLDSFDKALQWLDRHQPRLAKTLHEKRGLLQDFAFLRDYSHGCQQVFSDRRWALTGESGVFLDPFYSPGGDFIAIANTYITDLIRRERDGESFGKYAGIYERFFFSFYDSMLSLYKDQYPWFGNPDVFPVKIIWDYTYYWGVLCPLFFQRRLTDIALLGTLREELTGAADLNLAMQEHLRAWAGATGGQNRAAMIDQASLPWFARLNAQLRDELDAAAFARRIRTNTALLHDLAWEIFHASKTSCPGLAGTSLPRLLGKRPASVPSGNLLEGVIRRHAETAARIPEPALPC